MVKVKEYNKPFQIFYSILLVVGLLYQFIYVTGTVSIKHLCFLIMFFWLVKMKEIKVSGSFWLFVIYLGCFGLSCLYTGYGSVYVNKLFGTYLGCLVLYCSTKTMISKYNAIGYIIYTLLVIAVVDSIVTIGQFYNNPIASTIFNILNVSSNLEADMLEKYESSGGAISGLTAGGLLGGLQNGYFLSAALLLAFYNKEGEIKIYNWILGGVIYLGLFFTQERAGFYFGTIILLLYIFLNTSRNKKNIITILFIGVFLLILGDDLLYRFVDFENTRYGILESDMGGRSNLSAGSWDYVLSHPFGGAYSFFARGNRMPHNFIANSFLYGGILGGFFIMLLIFGQIWKSIRIYIDTIKKNTYSLTLIMFILLYLVYTLNSGFHNPCLATGTELFFVWWGCVEALMKKENINKKYKSY